ncbi:MAG: lysine 2,3-aminomutase, partial [Tannerellaceae bacterium]
MTKKEYQAFSLHNFRNIPQLSLLPESELEAIEVVGQVLPFKANNYVTEELINWNDAPNDPIFTLTFPR